MVTLLGLLVNHIPHLICLYYYGYNIDEGFSSAFCIFHALTFFFYLTMDNCDGKQSRRTGSSSPLGMIFDH
jgi:phosphatidylglycerophosphate synthase